MEKPIPEMIPVASSQIESIGFDAEDEAMFIKFPSGGLYRYDGVPQEVFDALAAAESKGSFFYRNIKAAKNAAGMLKFPYTKLPSAPTKSESGAASITDEDVPF